MPDGTSDSPERHQSQLKPHTEVVPRGLGRRRFIQGLAAGAGALTLGPPVIDAFRLPDFSIPPGQAERKLGEAGLGDYAQLYTGLKAFRDKYGVLQVPAMKGMYDKLQRVVDGRSGKDSQEAQYLRDGWGEKKGQALEDAQAKLPTFAIDPKNTGDDPEKVRQFIGKIGEIAPAYVLASPPTIHMLSGGGSAGEKVMELNAIQDKEGLGHIPQYPVAVAFHEMTHEIDGYPDRIKPYVTKEEYIAYLQTYTDAIDQYVDAWLTAPDLEGIVRGTEVSINVENAIKGHLAAWEEAFPEFKAHDLDASDKNVQQRFNHITQNVGRKWLSLQGRNDLTPSDQAFLSNPTAQRIMTQIVDTVGHRFVSFGPPFEDWKYKEGSLFESLHNLVNMQRLRTFAHNWDADKSYQTIADHFGIPTLARSPESMAGSSGNFLTPEKITGPETDHKKLLWISRYKADPGADGRSYPETDELWKDPERQAQSRTSLKVIETAEHGRVSVLTLDINDIQSDPFNRMVVYSPENYTLTLTASEIQSMSKKQNVDKKPDERTLTVFFVGPEGGKLKNYKNVRQMAKSVPAAYNNQNYPYSAGVWLHNDPPLIDENDATRRLFLRATLSIGDAPTS